MLVQLSIIYFGLFYAISLPRISLFGFVDISRFVPGVVALALNSSRLWRRYSGPVSLAVDKGRRRRPAPWASAAGSPCVFGAAPGHQERAPALANEMSPWPGEPICSMLGMAEIMFAA